MTVLEILLAIILTPIAVAAGIFTVALGIGVVKSFKKK